MTGARPALDLVRSLAGQLAAIAILFAGTAALAAIPVVWPRAFDAYLRETPPTLVEPSLRALADALAAGQMDAAALGGLSGEQYTVLYEDWLARSPRPDGAPRLLARAGGEAILARAQRTLVCGDAEQRTAALEFLALAGDPRAIPLLAQVESWAGGKRDPVLAAGAARVRATLEGR